MRRKTEDIHSRREINHYRAILWETICLILPDDTMVFRSYFLPHSREYIMIKIRLIEKN